MMKNVNDVLNPLRIPSLINRQRMLNERFEELKDVITCKSDITYSVFRTISDTKECAEEYCNELIKIMKNFGETEIMHRELDRATYISTVLTKCIERFKLDIETGFSDMWK